MTFERHLTTIFEQFVSSNSSTINNNQLIESIDLTLLKESASEEELSALQLAAQSQSIAALCTFPQYLHYFNQERSFNLATVVNFPSGNSSLITCLEEIKQAVLLGAQEIDYVFPYQQYLYGNREEALEHCAVVANLCKDDHLILKIIMETGAFSSVESIYQLSSKLLELGCTFLKTSTGKIEKGATLPAAFALLSAIKDSGLNCGLKVSGGVKTKKEALDYAALAEFVMGKSINKHWFRIGASALLQELQKSNLNSNPHQ